MNDFAVPVLGILVIALASFLLIFTKDQAIVAGEPFEVTSDTSKYSCIVSEIDNDLSLKCLKVK